MVFRLFLFLLGFGVAVIGGISTIAYLNLLTTGHGFIDYLYFISRRVECYLFPLGVSIIGLSIYIPSSGR
ncbi:hypothetical protein [Bacillus suaedaesalsae]|uniref:Uncharacterized protein n=1 Tax=Bacillus suaedaesalsae TaxID=2810349 RepID=A0ABS2DIF6_9BACI|nr:hypothetical protein [Bacillus suaedaesalsae]MBM6618287.1 hypothetical protein [Bacillus suaedaesalsae]